ncbi:Dehydrodolichyl diphosphate synthase complex subunit SPAC4D7.04c [Ceratocystis fimbriata CBS 114723]|uniref:Alkyl transferase n=1 Tax=Ceratocystis fimbriata CBS 114723 TaxID=1035309 RepID=A0A2C5XBS2_9PEZI|nr:Dehydrodolichyl diphosphate synthase complex subunit SPAC4D7.04c [Ceratocystis fimbriata CBS 114723]
MSDPYLTHLSRWVRSSPPVEWAVGKLHELLICALRQGPVPQHVAIVMDGNRRYARAQRMETIEGHHHGFEALATTLEILYKIGVKVVTVYAFSIENFNRPKYEVDGLMELAKVKLEQLGRHGDVLDRYGAKVCVLGPRNLLRPDVLEVVERTVAMTKDNKMTVLNICFPYTSREEITTAVRSTVQEYLSPPQKSTMFSPSRISQKVLSKHLDSRDVSLPTIRDASPAPSAHSDIDDTASTATTLPPDSPPAVNVRGNNRLPNPETITEDTINSHTYTRENPPLDIFIRTSGVKRLSDFMLWQCHRDTYMAFLSCYWPEFGMGQLLPVILEWQWMQKQKARDERPIKVNRPASGRIAT